MTRFCETCQAVRPADEFDVRGLCRRCAREARGGRRTVKVALPPGWETDDRALPEMLAPTPEEVEDGYEGVLWAAQKGPWRLEVLWRGDRAKFLCTVLRRPEDTPRETRTFDYPHEIVEWLGTWFAQLVRAR